jgi:hypothetical protein
VLNRITNHMRITTNRYSIEIDLVPLPISLRNDRCQQLTRHLRAGVPEQPFCVGIPQQDSTGCIDSHDPHASMIVMFHPKKNFNPA